MNAEEEQLPPSKVLIADDNPQILELVEAYLEPLKLEVSLAADGQVALDKVESAAPAEVSQRQVEDR